MIYISTQNEILAVKPRTDWQRDLIRRSDDLLERLETLNLAHYGAVKASRSDDACRLTHDLAAAVNDLAAELGLPARRLTTTRAALDAVYDAQSIIFGVPDDDRQEEFDI